MFYSIIVKFRAKSDIYFKNYPGENLHGMLFNILKRRNDQQATLLHDKYESKPFTISPILPYLKWKKGKRYLKSGKKHFIRVTFLEDQWYKLFMESFLYNRQNLKLGRTKIEVDEILTNSKEHKRCNVIEAKDLRNNSRSSKKIKLKFHSTTTFRDNDRHIIFPQEKYLFNSLLSKWKEFGGEKLVVDSVDFSKIIISRYELESVMEEFKNYTIKGFRGYCEYELDNNLSLDKIRDINLLADFSFYSGVGYKTTMGLGQVARI
jgi:CRISPR-associated endoribonuclease Cas6